MASKMKSLSGIKHVDVLQGVIYCILLFISAEEPIFVTSYSPFFQPFVVISILVGLYGLTITTMSLDNVAPGKNYSIREAKYNSIWLNTFFCSFLFVFSSEYNCFACT